MGPNESPDASFSYTGHELDIFSHAVVWKGYWTAQIKPYFGKQVLEVGAGTGTNTHLLANGSHDRWTCLEPDNTLVTRLKEVVAELPSQPKQCEVVQGFLSDLAPTSLYDTILYIDVLEHIEHDQQEMEAAYQQLAPGGHVIVLSPAHQFLFTTFDEGLGHFRRYSRQTLRDAGPKGAKTARLIYLDSVGFFASLANRFLLKQKLPSVGQIKFWDRYLVRNSKWVDPILGYNFGKSVLGVWQKPITN